MAGFDGLMIVGKAPKPSYLVITDGRVELRDAAHLWGMGTDRLEPVLKKELGDERFQIMGIGPSGEKQVSYACIIHTAARAAGRGGCGAVMGSKNLKAVAVLGAKVPPVADHPLFLERLEECREIYNGMISHFLRDMMRGQGTAWFLDMNSDDGKMSVRNFREGTFGPIEKFDGDAAEKEIWVRSHACYCCPLACKKSGRVRTGPFAGLAHDGPEYETGTMFGSNLMISDLKGVVGQIFQGDDSGMDIISAGAVIGFLMECREKGLIGPAFLDGIDLRWGDAAASMQMIGKISKRQGIGDLAARGVRALADEIGQGSHEFAIQVKGQELAAWNVQANPAKGLCYATANRGACHHSGDNAQAQDFTALIDSTGLCSFATDQDAPVLPGHSVNTVRENLAAVTGLELSEDELRLTGERIYNLEKMFNYREGFRREDDALPERFFKDAFTVGDEKGAVLDRAEFKQTLDEYYTGRGWDPITTRPSEATLNKLSLTEIIRAA